MELNNNIKLNDSISEQSKLTNLTNNININMASNNLNTNSYFDENEKVFSFEEKNSSNFHKQVFTALKLKKQILKNANIFNIKYDHKIKNINIKLNNFPLSNNLNNHNLNENIFHKKSTIVLPSFKKYNFDFPKILKDKYMNKEQENDSKSFINKKNNNNLGDKILKIENQPIVHLNFKNLKKYLKTKDYLVF